MGPFKEVTIMGRSLETWSKLAFFDREFQIQAEITNILTVLGP